MTSLQEEIDNVNGKNNSYFMKCRVEIINTKGIDTLNRKFEYDQAYLIPEQNTQYAKFIYAYNPFNDAMAEYIEMVTIMDFPIGKPCRIEFCTATEDYSKGDHFRVMTKEINDFFLDHKEIKEISFEIIPQKDEHLYSV